MRAVVQMSGGVGSWGAARRTVERYGRDAVTLLFADTMIGFLFRGKDRARLAQLEYEFTARFLGAEQLYTGRSIAVAGVQRRRDDG